jgi:thiamine-phosphate pyrophosphorylase
VYAIADITTLDRKGIGAREFAEAVIAGGACALQLRAKGIGVARMRELATALGALARAAGVPFFVNDAVDLAIDGGHHGVHLGQHDLPPREAEAIAARRGHPLAIGLSTHGEAELVAAFAQPLAYLAIGPVFDTASKQQLEPVLGIELARSLAQRAKQARPELPVVAIGGIDEAGAASLRGAVDALAVIGALLPGAAPSPGAVSERVRTLCAAFERGTP